MIGIVVITHIFVVKWIFTPRQSPVGIRLIFRLGQMIGPILVLDRTLDLMTSHLIQVGLCMNVGI